MSAIVLKLSTTVLVLGALLLAQSPNPRPATGQNVSDLDNWLQGIVGLSTQTLPPADAPPANWEPVADRGGAADCQRNLDSGVILCGTLPALPQPQLAQTEPSPQNP